MISINAVSTWWLDPSQRQRRRNSNKTDPWYSIQKCDFDYLVSIRFRTWVRISYYWIVSREVAWRDDVRHFTLSFVLEHEWIHKWKSRRFCDPMIYPNLSVIRIVAIPELIPDRRHIRIPMQSDLRPYSWVSYLILWGHFLRRDPWTDRRFHCQKSIIEKFIFKRATRISEILIRSVSLLWYSVLRSHIMKWEKMTRRAHNIDSVYHSIIYVFVTTDWRNFKFTIDNSLKWVSWNKSIYESKKKKYIYIYTYTYTYFYRS